MIRNLAAPALVALLLAAIPTLAQSPTGSWQVDAYPVDAAGHPAATTVKVPFSGVPIAPAQIPAPTASTLGGVKSATAPASQMQTGIDTSGNPTFAVLPSPGVSALGGVKSSAAPANNFQTGVDTGGNPTYAQPAAGNVSGLTAGATAAAGQLPGTATNDNANAGNVGEYHIASTAETGQTNSTSTVTITIATPAVVTWGTTVPYAPEGCAVINFTTTGALPTGIVAGTNYYVIGSSVSGNTFQIATSCDNAMAGTAIATSGTQSGTQTGVPYAILGTGVGTTVAGLTLSAGDWDISADLYFFTVASTSITRLGASISTTDGTQAGIPGQQVQWFGAATVPGQGQNAFHVGPRRFSLSSSTKIYAVDNGAFTAAALGGFGGIRARRVR